MRLIDAFELCDKYELEYKNSEGCARKAFDAALYILSDAPTIDAVLVVHGRWEDHDGKTWCSECGSSNKAYKPPYCPHCGAKMDLED